MPDSWATWNGRVQPPREQIGRYVILQTLGAGGMGVVYKAHDPQLERVVAVKVPRLEPGEASQVARLRFLREARAAAALRHPHVCPIHDVGEQDGVPYVVMAFVEGESLAQRLASRRFEDCRQAVVLAREIAEALAAVHAHGIIHRDLKPGNVLLDRAGHAVLTDFGLSRPEHDTEHLTEEGSLAGTPAYMAPEQARRGKVDARSDLFSLGTVLYEICTGELPFKGPTTMALLTALALDAPTPLAELNPDLPQELTDLLMQLLAKDPEQRPGSAREVVERLQAVECVLAGGQTAAPTRPARPRDRAKSVPARVGGPRSGKAARVAQSRLGKDEADIRRPTLELQPSRRSQGKRKRPSVKGKRAPRRRWWQAVLAVVVLGLLAFAAQAVISGLSSPRARAVDPAPPTAVYLNGLPVAAATNWPFREPIPGEPPGGPPDWPPPLGGHRVSVKGRPSPHGLWMHLPPQAPQTTSVSFRVGKRFSTFQSEVSLNDGPRECCPLTFAVYGDGQPLWRSRPVTTQADTQACSGLSVKGVETLTLEVSGPGDSRGTHAVWIEPYLTE